MLAVTLTDKLKALLPSETTGFAIAYSGGGDSTALLHGLKDHPQLKAVYVLDHGLREGSDVESRQALDFAQSLFTQKSGVKAELLSWKNTGIDSGIQERARTARYGIISAACRDAGIEYLLTGHHQDDQAETLFMRFEHKTGWRGAAGMADVTYAPIWPEMALVTLVRPLLDVPRADLREYNKAHGLSWAEDPSNDNDSFERVRARKYLKQHPRMSRELISAQEGLGQSLIEERQHLSEFARNHVKIDAQGIITICMICPPELFCHLLRAASGSDRLTSRAKISRLLQDMSPARFTSATLGGALIRRNPSEKGYIICRDPVAVTGRKDGGLAPQPLQMNFADTPQVWDGRYVLSGPSEYSINTAHAARELMTDMDLKRLREHPAAVRQTLPVVIKDGKIVEIGGQDTGETGAYSLKSLIRQRMESIVATKLP